MPLSDNIKNNVDFDIKFKMHQQVYKFNLLDELEFELATVNDEIVLQEQKAALITEMYDLAKYDLNALENEFKSWKAQVWCEIKDNQTDTGGKPYSDARVDTMLISRDKYKEYLKDINDAQYTARKLENCVERFRNRKDLLQTLSSNLRATT